MDKPRVPSACCVWYSGQGLTIVGPGNCYQNAEGKSYEATHDSGIFSCWGFSMHKVFFDVAATIARLIPPPRQPAELQLSTNTCTKKNILENYDRFIFQGNLFTKWTAGCCCYQVATSPPRPPSPCFTSRGPWWCWIGRPETWELRQAQRRQRKQMRLYILMIKLNYVWNTCKTSQ